MTTSWADGLQRKPARSSATLAPRIEWHPEFDDGRPAPSSTDADDGGSTTWPLVAHGMTGSITFDGLYVEIDLEEHATDRSGDRHVTIPLIDVRSIDWQPATTTHRGVMEIRRPVGEPMPVAFKFRQQADFDAVRTAIQKNLRRPS